MHTSIRPSTPAPSPLVHAPAAPRPSPARQAFAAPTAALVLALAQPGGAGVASVSLLASGPWSDPSLWSSNPHVPQNGQPDPDSTYAVTIANRVAEVDIDVTITNLTLAHVSGATNVVTNPNPTPTLLNVENTLAWTQGIISGNTTVHILPAGFLGMNATPVGQTKQLNATLVNEGTVTVNFLTNLQSTAPGSVFVNQAGGVVDLNGPTTFSTTAGSVDPRLVNKAGATINQNSPLGATINWILDNEGTVNVSGSSLTAGRGGIHSGVFNVAQNRTMNFSGSGFSHTLTPESSVTGPGTVAFNTATTVQCDDDQFLVDRMRVNGNVLFEGTAEEFQAMLDSLDALSGKVSGGSFTTMSLNWQGGEIATEVTVTPDGLLNGFVSPSSQRTLSGVLTNNGFANVRNTIVGDASDGPATLVNNGTFTTTASTTLAGDGTMVNNGTLKSIAGVADIEWELEPADDSSIEAEPGTVINLRRIAILRGAMKAAAEADINLLLADQELLDTVLGFAANLLADEEGSISSDIDLDLDSASTLRGRGTLEVDGIVSNGGTTGPGNSPGTLTIKAVQTVLTETHRLDMEFGAVGSADVDLLVVDGDLTLDGWLDVTALDGFGPGEYLVIDCTGTITDLGLELGAFPAGLAAGLVGAVLVDPVAGQVRLLVERADSSPDADLDGDGGVDGADLGLLLSAWGTAGPGDLDGDGVVSGADLGLLLAAWLS